MMASETYDYDLFVDYAAADEPWVRGFLLPALGLPAERVITPADFMLGAATISELERAIVRSRYTLLIFSPDYLDDEYTAFGRQFRPYPVDLVHASRLVPIILRPCTLPHQIMSRVVLDCTDEAEWPAAAARLRALLGLRDQQPEQIPCPYPGMHSFQLDNAQPFYGRDAEIQQMELHLRNRSLLVVIGPSGSGKSSLVFAGLLPRLTRSRSFPPDYWRVRTMRPGSEPTRTLVTLLAGDLSQQAVLIASVLAEPPPAQRLLIVVDQFEELFTQADREEQERFIAALQALRGSGKCALVLTMRADFYPDLMRSSLWPIDASQRLEVAPLRGRALREAIVQPAADVGVYLEPSLVERLLNDAHDEPGMLPLVQETMQLLWAKRQRRLLTLSAYEQLGQGGRSGLVVALARKADATFISLSAAQQQIARRILLRLVQFGEGRPDTRRQLPVAELRSPSDDPRLFELTLNQLISSRLLIVSSADSQNEALVDTAHEALITGWPRLQEWLLEAREQERFRRRLEAKAAEWERLGRGVGGLLDKVELSEAEQWLARSDAVDLGLSEAVLLFIQVSQAEQERVKQTTPLLTRLFPFLGRGQRDEQRRELTQTRAVDLDIQRLERCADITALRSAHSQISVSELDGPASNLLRRFKRLSQDIDAGLNQENTFNQRLVLQRIEEQLDDLERELTRSSERYANRFLPIGVRWRRITAEYRESLVENAERLGLIDSPYLIGVPLTREQEIFTGRADIAARIEQLLRDQRRPPLLLYGERRMGKTSLLFNLSRLLPSNIVPLFVDLQGAPSLAANHASLLYNLARAMVRSAEGLERDDVRLVRVAQSDFADDPFTCFDEWLDSVERALGQSTALLMLDEFEALDRALMQGRFDQDAVLGLLRHMIQHRPRFKILLAGSHTLAELERWSNYLINVQVVHVSYLTENESRRLIERPVADFALRYEPDATQRVLELTRGHPFLIQLLCAEIIALKNEQTLGARRLARRSDVEAAIPEALDHGRSFFFDIRHNQIDSAGLALLRFLAAQGEGAVVAAEALQRQAPDGFEAARDRLLQRSLIEAVGDGFRFEVELIRRWFAQET